MDKLLVLFRDMLITS